MKQKNQEISKILDEKDKKILELLQYDSRESLTKIAKEVGLSIDSTHKRLKRLRKEGVLHLRGLVDPKKIGYPLTTDVYIKLQNIKEDEYNKLIKYLKTHPRITSLLSVMGEYDLIAVIMTKDAHELEELSRDIRQRFSNLIADWKSLIVVKVHKFEEYKFSESI